MEELRPGHTRLHRNLQGAVFQSPTQLPLTVVNEPRVELDKAQYFAILKGGLTYTYQQFSAVHQYCEIYHLRKSPCLFPAFPGFLWHRGG